MNTEPDSILQAAVEEYLGLLRAGDFDSAFHGLIDLPPAVAMPLIAAYNAENSRDVRSGLLRILWELRTPLAVPLLEDALRDRRDERWKDALDGLVALASPETLRALERVLSDASSVPGPDLNYVEWLEEARQQTLEAMENPASFESGA